MSLTAPTADDSYFTVEKAVDVMGFGPFQILVTFFCGMLWVSKLLPHLLLHLHHLSPPFLFFFLQMSDAMELMVLAVLSPIVECDFDLTKLEEAMITSVSDDVIA